MRLAQVAGKRLMASTKQEFPADVVAFFLAMESTMAQRHLNLRPTEAIELPGCPICRIVLQRVAQSMESIDYEFVNDPGWRSEVEAAWGFCNLHAQQWLEHAHPLGTALIYEAVLARITDQMNRQHSARPGFARALLANLSGAAAGGAAVLVEPGVCPFCTVRENEAGMAIAQLLDDLAAPEFRERYAASDGLCVTHLDAALRQQPNAEVFDALRARLIAAHRQLRDQLQEIIRKHDYRFHNALLGAERGSVERAVHQIAGLPGIGDRRFHPPVSG